MKGSSESLVASALFTFCRFYFSPAGPCVIIYVTFSSDRTASTAVLFLINVTRFSYLSSVTTIILPTSLRSLMPVRKIFFARFPVSTSVFLFCSARLFCAIVMRSQQLPPTFLSIGSFLFVVFRRLMLYFQLSQGD